MSEQIKGSTYSWSRKAGETSLSSLSRKTNHTTLSSNTLGTRSTRGTLQKEEKDLSELANTR